MSTSLKLSVVACLLLIACKEGNPRYCEGNPDDLVNCPPPDGGQCTDDAACPGQICDTASGACVQCTPARADACSATTPVCGDGGACTACTRHAQCAASQVCLPDGACAEPDQVAYVSASGSGTACTRAAPCPLLASAIATNLPTVKIAADGATKASATVIIDGKAVVVLAEPGAELDRDGDGPIFEVRSANADVAIYDLHITGASGLSGGDGILVTPNGGLPKLRLTRVKLDFNAGVGISASGGAVTVSQSTIASNTSGGISASGGALTVSQSTIASNAGVGISASGGALTVSQSTIASNTGGGISVMSSTFGIVGNVLYKNGTQGSLAGALVISAPANSVNRVEFNSFSKNASTDGVAPSIQCTTAGAFTARNNIMSDNGTLTNLAQVGGTCLHAYSIARPGPVPPGTANSALDPLFVDITAGNLHLSATSPARGMADPSTDLTGLAAFDIDGDPRTSPADLGADQLP